MRPGLPGPAPGVVPLGPGRPPQTVLPDVLVASVDVSLPLGSLADGLLPTGGSVLPVRDPAGRLLSPQTSS